MKVVDTFYEAPSKEYEEELCKNFCKEFREIEMERKSSFCKEFKLICLRNMRAAVVSPIGIMAVFMMAFFNAVLLWSLFGGLGKDEMKLPILDPTNPDFDPEDPYFAAHNGRVAKNWMGLVNFCATDQFITMSMAQVMIIPRLRPIYNREKANNMYQATSYFLAMWATSALSFIAYPFLAATMSFYYLGFENSNFTNYLQWLLVILVMALSGSSFGFMFGCLLDDEMSALMINQACILAFNFGSGLFASNNGANFVIKFLAWISPFRYASESMMRTFLKDKDNVQVIFDRYNYDYGSAYCIMMCAFLFLGFFALSWIAIEVKARKLIR